MADLRVTVDEIERGSDGQQLATLVTDEGDTIVVPLAVLPDETRDGDVLLVRFEREPEETERRRSRISDLQKRLFGEQ
jgi:hypothetical protein